MNTSSKQQLSMDGFIRNCDMICKLIYENIVHNLLWNMFLGLMYLDFFSIQYTDLQLIKKFRMVAAV